MITFYEYSKCTSCQKGKKFLNDHNIGLDAIDMVTSPPSRERLQEIIDRSELTINEFFNKRGKKFNELKLADRLTDLTNDEKLDLLTSDGMLIRRPIVVSEDKVVLGFREKEYRDVFNI